MEEKHIIWRDFVEQNNKKLVKTWVDIRKGHRLMKTSVVFRKWWVTMNEVSTISLVAIILSVVFFFNSIWIIPVIVTIVALIALQAIREEAEKAIVDNAMRDEVFYYYAVNSKTLRVTRVVQ